MAAHRSKVNVGAHYNRVTVFMTFAAEVSDVEHVVSGRPVAQGPGGQEVSWDVFQ